MCPLKDAARDAPRHLAILAKDFSLTFFEFDAYVDRFTNLEPTPLHRIASFFSAWRKNQSIFSVNPRIPQAQFDREGPPQSLLLFTSGSTGTPKIAILSLSNLLANASSAIAAVDLRPNDQWRLSLPLHHVGGIGIVFRCILARATLVLDDSPDITHLSYVPTHLYRATPIYRRLRCLLLGGAPISSYPKHLPVYTTYGLTEMASTVTLNGQLLPNRELRLAPDGEIWVKGPCLFKGYWGESPQQGWFPTGDLGKYGKDGLQILGRKDWMFISGGENIQPEEIERELLFLPEVAEAVVLPKDDPEFGQRPVAIVRAQAPFDFKRMQSALSTRLPKYKIPTALYLVDEIQKKDNFKADRFILSQNIKKQLDPNISGQKKPPYL